jgi:squalene-hopene/tetraprenyl-beta-curcumene cyclase
MTYTGFKSLLYAGVDRKDPRVQAAFRWIQKHWRLDANPNMPQAQSQAGLFYYYHVFAKALAAWGEPVIIDARGARHNWRHELIDQLASLARPDGSWVNAADRWQESSPVLTTIYSLLALEEAVRDQSLAAATAPATAPAGG